MRKEHRSRYTLAGMYKLRMVHDGSEFNRSISVHCRWAQVFANHD